MGSSQSYLTDPSKWATPVKETEEGGGNWKVYDYVIVGGGAYSLSFLFQFLYERPFVFLPYPTFSCY